MIVGRWILEDGQRVPCDQLLESARCFEASGRARTVARSKRDDDIARCRPCSLGLDHRHFGEAPPILWETLVLGGALDREGGRYPSRVAVEAGPSPGSSESASP